MQHNYLTLLSSHQLTNFRVCRVSCLCASHSLPKQISHSRSDCRCILEGRSVTEILFLRILLSASVGAEATEWQKSADADRLTCSRKRRKGRAAGGRVGQCLSGFSWKLWLTRRKVQRQSRRLDQVTLTE